MVVLQELDKALVYSDDVTMNMCFFKVEKRRLYSSHCFLRGSCGWSGKALSYGVDGPGSIPGVGGGGDSLHSFVSRLLLGSTQPPIKWVLGVNMVKCRASHPTSWRRGCEYVDPCIHMPRGPSWPVIAIPFIMVFLCKMFSLPLWFHHASPLDWVIFSFTIRWSIAWLVKGILPTPHFP